MTLDHSYVGPATRLDAELGYPTERIGGAFRVLRRDEDEVEVGNGESPEARWLIGHDDLSNLFPQPLYESSMERGVGA